MGKILIFQTFKPPKTTHSSKQKSKDSKVASIATGATNKSADSKSKALKRFWFVFGWLIARPAKTWH